MFVDGCSICKIACDNIEVNYRLCDHCDIEMVENILDLLKDMGLVDPLAEVDPRDFQPTSR